MHPRGADGWVSRTLRAYLGASPGKENENLPALIRLPVFR